MSTLKVTNIESPSGGGVNAKISDINGGQLSNRNLIINGSMRVSQRTSSTTAATSGGAYGVDRWEAFASGGGAYTQEQSTTVPNSTFENSAKLTVTTADSSIAAADYYAFNYNIEGNDIISTGMGTSDAVTMTLSFWARSSVGGKYSVTVYNHNGSRGYLNTFDLKRIIIATNNDDSKDVNTGALASIKIASKLSTVFDLSLIKINPPVCNDFGEMLECDTATLDNFQQWYRRKDKWSLGDSKFQDYILKQINKHEKLKKNTHCKKLIKILNGS